MGKKQTKEEYVADCLVIHRRKYYYGDAVYISGKHKIEITCPDHGNFWQLAESHKQGRGCPACARINSTTKQMLTQEEAVSKLYSVFPSYDFSTTVYVGAKSKVSASCPKHGIFTQVYGDLAQGHGCQQCSREAVSVSQASNTSEFVYKALIAKESFYSYPRTVYVNSQTKVIITCPIHNDFLQTPTNHLSGAGCPTCGKTGFNRNKPAYLYILHSGDTTKVGITGRAVGTRVKQLVSGGSPDFEVHATFYFKDGNKALDLEAATLQWLQERYTPISAKFVGSKECFTGVSLQALLNFVTEALTTESEQSDHNNLPKEHNYV